MAFTASEAMPQARRTVALADKQGVSVSVYLSEEVDIHPSFPGGDRELLRFVNSERRYPARAYKEGIEGRVMCSFIVGTDGSISRIEVVRGVEQSLNAEAVRVIQAMPRWQPGSIDGEPVATYCLLPIAFRK